MNGFLLDTSICIALFRENRAVAHKLDEVGMQNCYVNDVVIAELLVGAYYSEHFLINKSTQLHANVTPCDATFTYY